MYALSGPYTGLFEAELGRHVPPPTNRAGAFAFAPFRASS